MNQLPDMIAVVCNETHVPLAGEVFGQEGIAAAFQIMEVVRDLYKQVEPERIIGKVIVLRIIDDSEIVTIGSRLRSLTDLSVFSGLTVSNLCIEIHRDGQIFEVSLGIALSEVAQRALVYTYEGGSEEFYAKERRRVVPRLDPCAKSQFAVPTLSSLREALRLYERDNVRESTCYIFREVWHDRRRLFLKAKPEARMRNSLTQFLRNRIGAEHDVWPEQNVDESHPVDIQVQPKFSNNRLMLIEIKWLGQSVADDGHITARHGEPRAQEGAVQLADYLDSKRQSAPSRVIHGYYVIIDARRDNLREGIDTLSKEDGLRFESASLPFNPAPHLHRSDFDEPYRMFAKPICP